MRIVGAAGAAFLLSASVLAGPANAASGDDGARAADVAGSAQALNLSIADAATRADLQSMAEKVGSELSANPEVSAFWLEDPPSTAFVVATPPGSKLRVADLVLPAALAKATKLTAVKHSEADLAATASSLGRSAAARGQGVDVHVDVRRQVVEVAAADAASAAEVAADVATHVDMPAPDAVSVSVEEEMAQPAVATIYAGMAGSGCTSGFSVVRTSDGKRGISTAAHCSNGQTYAGVGVTYVSGWQTYSSDIQWNTASSTSAVFRNWARDGTYDSTPYYRTITGTIGRTSLVLGGAYCKNGNVTNYGCGTLKSRTEYVSWVTNSSATFLALDNSSTVICLGGDSGGPVYSGNSAIGLISGTAASGHRLIAMSMSGFAQTNIKVATS